MAAAPALEPLHEGVAGPTLWNPHLLDEAGGGTHSFVAEQDFVAGVRRSSSPRPGGSSTNHQGDLHIRDPSRCMCIRDNTEIMDMDLSNVSSDLPEFVYQPCATDSASSGQDESDQAPRSPILIESSEDSLNMSSVSNRLPQQHPCNNPPSPPQGHVSLSDIFSSVSTEQLHPAPAANVRDDLDCWAQALVEALIIDGGGIPGRGPNFTQDHMYNLRRVARWLLSECSPPNQPMVPVWGEEGDDDNPIVLSD